MQARVQSEESWRRMIPEIEKCENKTRWLDEHNLTTNMYYYWKKKLYGRTESKAEPAGIQVSSPQQPQPFVEVPTSAFAGSAPEPENDLLIRPAMMLEICGKRLYIDESVSSNTLASLMEVLRNA